MIFLVLYPLPVQITSSLTNKISCQIRIKARELVFSFQITCTLSYGKSFEVQGTKSFERIDRKQYFQYILIELSGTASVMEKFSELILKVLWELTFAT